MQAEKLKEQKEKDKLEEEKAKAAEALRRGQREPSIYSRYTNQYYFFHNIFSCEGAAQHLHLSFCLSVHVSEN